MGTHCEKIDRKLHPCLQFCDKYQHFPTDFHKCRTSSTKLHGVSQKQHHREANLFYRFTIRYSTNVLHFLACLQKSKEYKTKSENRPRKQLTLHIAILPWYLDLNEKCNKKYNKRDKWLGFFVIFITFLHFNPDYFVKLGCVCHRLCLLLLWTRGMEGRRKVSSWYCDKT
jgi:hypothetical protein